MPHVDAEVGIFNDFSLSFDEDVQAIDNGFISLKIPANMEQEYIEGVRFKKYNTYSGIDKNSIILTAPSCIDYDDILKNEELDNIPGDHGMENIMDGFEKIGKGLPDNWYNMEKTMLLVDSNDYSFWDINQGASFLLAASSKYILTSMCSEVMLYEREDIKAIMYITHKKDGTEYVMATIYDANDLNSSCTLTLYLDSIEDAYRLLNSIEMLEYDTLDPVRAT